MAEIVDSIVARYGIPGRSDVEAVDSVPDHWRGKKITSDCAYLMDRYGGCIALYSWIILLDPWAIYECLVEFHDDMEYVHRGEFAFIEPGGEEVRISPSHQARKISVRNLVKFGETDTGVEFFWHALGKADDWNIFVVSSNYWQEYQISSSEFIYGILSGGLGDNYLTSAGDRGGVPEIRAV
ncbi:hypothetical protein [Nocardiopsis sp. FIRDI 009]|uniref:hypothetical protein n=1 Tax=Nocardiopsis sp. FIRDI 009 TaxID=714197 RepID=UPI00130084FB|nr:hypothetical protein [Nocardiopsis sp. FIRDI 009]